MASALSFPFTSDFIVSSSIFPKQSLTVPLFPLQPLSSSSLKLVFRSAIKASSSSSSSSSAASVPETVIEPVPSRSFSSNSVRDSRNEDSASSSSSSSSKLVLVVGGSGGVGNDSLLSVFLFILSCKRNFILWNFVMICLLNELTVINEECQYCTCTIIVYLIYF